MSNDPHIIQNTRYGVYVHHKGYYRDCALGIGWRFTPWPETAQREGATFSSEKSVKSFFKKSGFLQEFPTAQIVKFDLTLAITFI